MPPELGKHIGRLQRAHGEPLWIPQGRNSWGPRPQPASLAPGESEVNLCPAQSLLRSPPNPSRPQIYTNNRPLRIGYYESDGFTQPSPSMVRAVRLTSRLLQDAGHQVGFLRVGNGVGEEAGLMRMCGWTILGEKGSCI